MSDLSDYHYGGARALVSLHEQEMAAFLDTWETAKAANVTLPELSDDRYVADTSDNWYASMDRLLNHVLRCGRSYMVWMCKNLGLPDPEIDPAPNAEEVADRANAYLEHLIEKWRKPLVDVPPKRFFDEVYERPPFKGLTIESMLEHAVVHPMRHRLQLERLMEEQ